MTDTEPVTPIRTAVITGQHPFDVPSFYNVFHSMPDVDFYPQDLDLFAADWGNARQSYDVVVFYNFHQMTPGGDAMPGTNSIRQSLEQLGEKNQGILVLHHAILAFPQWQFWSDLCGIQDRHFGYHPGQTVNVQVSELEHPITRDISDWEILDETYTMADAGADSHVLLTAEHPASMHTLAWTRTYGSARVFCYQSGHDAHVFNDPSFRRIMHQGIQWLARRR